VTELCAACGLFTLVGLFLAWPSPAADKPAFSLERRVPWTTSKVKGSPEPPDPYHSEMTFPKLPKFFQPLDMAAEPGCNRFFVAERYGKVFAFADAPPRVRHQRTIEASARARRRSLAIRHVSGHRLVALHEIVSPANKDRRKHVSEFVAKAVSAVDLGVHLLLVDLFPPGTHAPYGMHGAIEQQLDPLIEPDAVPAEEPLTLASYAAGPRVEIYLEHVAVGAALPDMPLFLRPDRYIEVPLEATYLAAYRGLPAYWRNVLEGKSPEFDGPGVNGT
jgi:hypothetical protein